MMIIALILLFTAIKGYSQTSIDLTISAQSRQPLRGLYFENTTIIATCTAREMKPKPSLIWYIGYTEITKGLSSEEILKTSNSSFTVTQNYTHRLSVRDHGKTLKCKVDSTMNDNKELSERKRIEIMFAPQSKNKTEEEVLVVLGHSKIISIIILANPKPSISWNVVNDDAFSKKLQYFPTKSVGNGKWKTSLGIYNISQNDENTKIFWKAVNEAGKINGSLKLLIKRETANHVSPQSINSTEVEVSLTVGQDTTIPITIVANPKPDISWEIGSENIHEGGKDSTQRFEVPPIVFLGNGTWETSLIIHTVSLDDSNKTLSWKAVNDAGEAKGSMKLLIPKELRETPNEDRPCPEITEECLTCLCEAVSDCDFRIMCNRKENSCGPFLIRYGFWQDGGEQESKKNTLDGLEPWQKCAQDPECAANTVRSYTKRYCKEFRKLNPDSTMNCTDFARMHQIGPLSTTVTTWFHEINRKLEECLKEIT